MAAQMEGEMPDWNGPVALTRLAAQRNNAPGCALLWTKHACCNELRFTLVFLRLREELR
jgi:hypothetical protein